MPTPEPMSYDRTDGQWYAHDGVDIKETQSRKGNQIFIWITFFCFNLLFNDTGGFKRP